MSIKIPEKGGANIGKYRIYPVDDLKNLDLDILVFSLSNWSKIVPEIVKIKEKYNLKFNIVLGLSSDEINSSIDVKSLLPNFLIDEWKKINLIQPDIFPENKILQSISLYQIPVGYADKTYSEILNLGNRKFDYVYLLPWLNKGGGELSCS